LVSQKKEVVNQIPPYCYVIQCTGSGEVRHPLYQMLVYLGFAVLNLRIERSSSQGKEDLCVFPALRQSPHDTTFKKPSKYLLGLLFVYHAMSFVT
jgi:hypothetical protein